MSSFMSSLSLRYDEVDKHGGRFRGKKELLKHLANESNSPKQAMLAKCYDCMGYYTDGTVDCHIPICPLYPFMMYREEKPISRRTKRSLTDIQKQAIRDRFTKKRLARVVPQAKNPK